MQISSQKHIVFHIGGPSFHPVAEQAQQIVRWLDDSYRCTFKDGGEAFDVLATCDLLVIMGLHWTGMSADWCGNLPYRPLTEQQKSHFEEYVASGRPLLAHHGGIASYDDWPRFGELLGFTWKWGVTNHSPLADHQVEVLPTGHPIVQGVEGYRIFDELYYDVQLTSGVHYEAHAQACWKERTVPMITVAEGGRVPGAGHAIYLANGHDMRAFECEALKQIWRNCVSWLLQS